ncbi:MAG: preprotein translocase subunit YajC [Verrucomicrobiaceae bacterium]|nr:MAG: preprotein translocase subunit YajC [Verrucomicrobiaceae bacterium]
MNLSALSFLAQDPAPAGSPLGAVAMPVLLIVMFYFMLIRPQRRQQKEHQARLAALKTGDEVIAAGGIHGLVTNVNDRVVTLKIADGVKIKIEKISVTTITKKSDEPEAAPSAPAVSLAKP